MAPQASRFAASAATGELEADDAAGIQIIELTGADVGVIRTGSRRWVGVFIAIAAALTGFGFVSHGSEAVLLGPVRGPAEVATVASPNPGIRGGPIETTRPAQELADQPLLVTGPAEGARVTSGVAMTGAAVTVEADARRPLGLVHASVTIGELVLGSRDVDVQAAGPFQVRIALFPPPFDAPVTLRMQAAPSDGRGRLDVSRDFHLAIPSAVGFWEASPTGTVDTKGRAQMRIRGYAPLSARTVDIAVRDARRRDVATASVRIAFDGELPGGVAGRILGLGIFDSTLWLPSGPTQPLTLRATWRDAATGARLHMDTALELSDPTRIERRPADAGGRR